MTQYQQGQYYGQPSGDPYAQPAKTSGMAITALVMSIVGIIPCCGWVTAPLGALLGLISVVSIGRNPMLKGRGLGVVAMLLGIIISIAWVIVGFFFYEQFIRPVMVGPRDALIAGHNGDIRGFKSEFVGAGATASDEVAQAFLDELEARYGKFQSSFADDRANQPGPQPGEPTFTVPYRFEFANQTVSGEATYELADQTTGRLIQKWSEIVIEDSSLGNLVYPPPTEGEDSSDDGGGDGDEGDATDS